MQIGKEEQMAAWALKDAETSAKEVFERAFTGEPQIVTRRGVPSLVIITYADYKDYAAAPKERGHKRTTGAEERSLVDALMDCPYDISDLIEDRTGYELPSAFDRAGGFSSEEYA